MTDKIVEDYLDAVATQDWERMVTRIREDVVRIGPFGDVYSGRDDYVKFLADLMPTLPGYSMNISRVTAVDDGRRVIAELSETIEMDGKPLVTPEVLLFDLDADGLIARIEIFTRRS